MCPAEPNFYVTEGPLPPGAPSYIARQVDAYLVDRLAHGQLCCILGGPQAGKTSLVLHTAEALRSAGAAVAILNVASFRDARQPGPFWDSLKGSLAEQLGLWDALPDFDLLHQHIEPFARWMACIRRVVLPSLPGRLVVLMDNVDSAHELPFPTHAAFATLCEVHDPRMRESELSRLAFCLLGKSEPPGLAEDACSYLSCVSLPDFTDEQAAPLAAAMGDPEAGPEDALLRRVLYWTGGHPYLTQTLCRAVAASSGPRVEATVDSVCAEVFGVDAAVERDRHLAAVAHCLTGGAPDAAAARSLYARVAASAAAEGEAAHRSLRLLSACGLVRPGTGALGRRNRIYASVFGSPEAAARMAPGGSAPTRPPAEPPVQAPPPREAPREAPPEVPHHAAVRAPVQAPAHPSIRTSGGRDEDYTLPLEPLARVHVDVPSAQPVRHPASPQRRRSRLPMTLAAVVVGVVVLGAAITWSVRRAGRPAVSHPRHTVPADYAEPGAVPPGLVDAYDEAANRNSDQSLQRAQSELVEVLRDRAAAQQALAQGGNTPDAQRRARELLDDAARHEAKARVFHYIPHINDARKAWQAGDIRAALAALRQDIPRAGQEDLRGFEWRYLWRLTHSSAALFDAHQAGVTSVAFSPDGRTVASGSRDGRVRLWSVGAKQCVAALGGGHGVVRSIAIAHTGDMLAAAQEDGTLRVWSLPSGREVAITVGHRGAATCVAFSPAGRVLSSVGTDGVIKLWGGADWHQQAAFTGPIGPLTAVAFSPDGTVLATCGTDGATRLWDPATRRQLDLVSAPAGAALCVAFSPSGASVVTGGADGFVRIWDRAQHRETGSVQAHEGPVGSAAFAPDGKMLVTGGDDGVIRRWEPGALRPLGTLRGHCGAVWSVAVSPDGQYVASGSSDLTARLWRSDLHQEGDVLPGEGPAVTALRFAPRGTVLAVGRSDGTLRFRDGVSFADLGLLASAPASIRCAVFDPDGALLAAGVGGDVVRLWNVHARALLREIPGMGASIDSVAISPDGRALATVVGASTVALTSTETHHEIGRLSGNPADVRCLAFSADSRVLAVGCADGSVRLWDMRTRGVRDTLRAHTDAIRCLRFAPDGRTMATAGTDGTVKLWDVWNRLELAAMRGHEGLVTSITFSPDGRTLASSGADGTVRLWSVAAGHETMILGGPPGEVSTVAFSRDGSILAAGGKDGTVRFWRALQPFW